ncbi:MAG TPA: class I SAM-dependent methyltransferase [Candidatus Eisenbacteria bacterium]|jgi:SAM-dependent methyltransferase
MTVASEGKFERDYFEKTYRNYSRQNPRRKLCFYRGLVERAAPRDRAPRILDIGCAFGAFLSELDPQWKRFGIDVSEFAIERAAQVLPDATFARAGATDIPFPGPFDVITALDVIEHVPSLEQVASSIKAKLSPEGCFLFVVPVYDGVTGPAVHLLDRDETHLHKRSRGFWLRWAEEHFVPVEWLGLLRYLLPGGYYLHVSTRALRRFTPAIAVVARNRPS